MTWLAVPTTDADSDEPDADATTVTAVEAVPPLVIVAAAHPGMVTADPMTTNPEVVEEYTSYPPFNHEGDAPAMLTNSPVPNVGAAAVVNVQVNTLP
jgi:hypothetical protein